ncbi:hypothetical protein Dred_0894 [Desulforamulus reducens MI-1]|uniref:ParB/Sulfiredoxin domain-containing protein n=1 Tax=Desulforamulus reducens (strain ATCC BAA-1160 / DSM 100696 / MI-1) TaxID=349161 RepID=A4J2X7_DESRM|nr:hypothetical protein [Desulforamulus reducens]ABO49430.1 hypothetical protein Dred_0894 [Desulforamulus reducens MI-1]
MSFIDVDVNKIVEYPTTFGSPGCHLLDQLGICFYTNTVEKIMYTIQSSATDPEKLSICKSGYCGKLLDAFKPGHTPGNHHDPITLSEYNGKYWVGEGKHRVCIAKRFGIKTIQANITKLDRDIYSLLPTVGSPGLFSATKIKTKRHFYTGQYLFLWAGKPDHTMGGSIMEKLNFKYRKGSLDVCHNIFDGLDYSQIVASSDNNFVKRLICGNPQLFSTYVSISNDHPLTKIWLVRLSFDDIPNNKNKVETLYRVGLWRKHHEKELINSLDLDFY